MEGNETIFQRVKRLVVWHFNTVQQERTPEEEEREAFFLGRPFNRWIMVPAAIVAQACVGSYFAWTVYNVPIEKELHESEGSAAITFFITMALVGVSGATCGPLVDRKGPRKSLQASGLIIYLGHIVAAVGVHFKSLPIIYIGYGALVGLGTGVAFLCPISPLLKWFPDKRGLISMLGVAGFSGGTTMFSLAEGALIPRIGVTWTLFTLSSVCFFVYMSCSFILRTPPLSFTKRASAGFKPKASAVPLENSPSSKQKKETSTQSVIAPVNASQQFVYAPESTQGVSTGSLSAMPPATNDIHINITQPEWTLLECLNTYQYWCFYFVFIAVCVPTFLTSAKLADMCQLQFGESQQVASIVVAAFAGVSLVGRIFFGSICDRTGRKNLYLLSLAGQGACLIALPFIFDRQIFGAFVGVMMVMALLNIGPTLAAAYLADLFGPKNVAGLYGFLLTAAPSLVGLVGGAIFASVYRMEAGKHGPAAPDVYNINFYWMAALAFVGFFVTLAIRKPQKKVTEPSSSAG
eukprot:comp18620_c1_seq1/m.20210 comp18620_c1_seq1/g.20210  ORF comp18620_c1_seq1/g.20210 comp18620_c1_seq1/m.20210 type:complete len:521 (-) comp18620_c1_seq1:69-1631(-)